MEGGVDDDEHGSGWFEVKKKHRTSSKLSIQKVSGGSFNKTQPCSPYKASDSEVGILHNRRQAQIIKDGVGFTTHPKVSSDVTCSSAVMADNGNDCLDKVMVNKENGPPQALPHTDIEFAASEVKTKVIQESSIKDNLDVSKIKWGDLEDDAFSPFIGYGNPEENFKTKSFGVSDDYVLGHANAMESDELVVSISPCTLQEGKLRKEVVELLPDRTLSSAMHGECIEGTWKEVTEIPSENFEAGNAKSVNASETQHVDRIKRVITDEPEEDLGPNDPMLKHSPALSVDGPLERTLQESYVRSEEGTLNISELSVINENRDMSFSLQNTILVSHQNDGAEISCDASHTSDTEDSRGPHDSIEGAELGECEEGESKERFKERLWCFLFENLNRAVDELYLLCELECDMDQMNEAILVLEEASSDFKELRCRVEHFENTKRSIPQSSKDGMPVNAKTEHRRPHALSWEVRRMTTSPHRAEILSSSLEAFKKIQLERTRKHVHLDTNVLTKSPSTGQHFSRSSPRTSNLPPKPREPSTNTEKLGENLDAGLGSTKLEKLNGDPSRKTRASSVHNGRLPAESLPASALGKSKREQVEPISETENQLSRKDRLPIDKVDKQLKGSDTVRKQISLADKEKEKEKEKRNTAPWKPMDAWKEKRNWEDILKSPLRNSSRVSHSPGLARKGMERARVLHDKLMSPEKRRKTALDMKREAEEKHARAMRIRSQLESERVQRLQRTSEKLNRVNEWQAGRSLKLREGMHARHQRSESRHEAYLAQVAKRAGDESSKVNEVRFITSLNEENKKLILRQKLHDSEMRRAEKLQVIKTKQKEDTAREEAVLERRKLLEAEKLQRLAETQRKKEEAQVRRDEERKASSAAREAKALEQLRKKEVRARAQQEEAELLAQKLAERLSESEQRRKFYLEQIRERASMDFRDQSSPLLRRSLNKEGQGRPISTNSVEDYQTSFISTIGDSVAGQVSSTQQQSLKRRIKKIRQRLMALKYEFSEPPVGADNSGICYRALVGTARAKIGRWLQDLQKLRQARKDGAASIGLIVGDMVKFLEGKDPELHASRQAGLLDFISSALPASHTSKPEACQVTVYLLRLLRVVLSVPANRSYFLVHNLLPPIIPMLSASLENYIKIAASSIPGSSNILSSKSSTENLESIIEVLDGSLWTVTIIMGYAHTDDRQLQMLDGLLELIVAYQIIHRLRDLFALYDRPQVEGNPFPSSILLSLNLLVVLTSRYRTISPIDWEACISKAASGGEIQDPKSLRYPGIGEFSMQGNSTKHVIVDSLANEVGQMSEEKLQFTMSDVPEIRTLDGEHRNNCLEVANDLDNVETEKQAENTSGEVLLLDENAKKCSPQKGENNLIDGCKEKKGNNDLVAHDNIEIKKECGLRQPIVFLLSSITETGLVGLPSLLTAVLLQANNRLSSEQASYILPSNFEEVATGVLKVLNNLAVLDIILLQKMLARPDLKMEFFHLMSFLLSYCTSKWKAANDQVGLLLLESLLLLGYFALFHPGNQAVLRWGKSPTILHKVCDLPFVFFSDPELTPILASTLVAACFCCDQNRGVVLQELSVDMLLSLLKSCRQGFFTSLSDSSLPESFMVSDQCEGVHLAPQSRRPQGDILLKLNRRNTRSVLGKGAVSGSTMRASKVKGQRESRGTKTCDEWALKHSLPALETSQTFMLHRRFPTLFLDKAEEFFSAGSSDLPA